MNRNWDIYMVGTLAEAEEMYGGAWKDSVFINKYNSLQFAIKLISDQPESFPNNRYFTVYTSDIQDCDFEDDITLSEEERVYRLKNFLSKRLLIFKPVQKGENFVVRDVKQVVKPINYKNNSTYIPVPLFTANNLYRKFEEFLNSVSRKEFIDQLDGISNEVSDTPSIIAWKDEQDMKVIGSFNSHVYSRGKIKFEFEYLKHSDINQELFLNIIQSPEIRNILFVGTDVYLEMERLIDHGITFEEDAEETKVNLEEDEEEKVEEKVFINNFVKRTKDAGLIYDEKDLINFHTAMKSSNLVILSGMSGTGKSKLVQMYGEALGLDSSQLNIIPVRPSWCDDRDLLGYVDSIHNIYKPGDTSLIDTLVQADKNIDKIYIVCFDEMNLARVEYYFAQFLSILEMDSTKRKVTLYNNDLENKLYNADKYPSQITIRDNILFAGTVNIDESTYHFSDKVLDRANVITLGSQDLNKIKDVKFEKQIRCNEIMFTEYNQYKVIQSEVTLKEKELDLLNILNIEINKTNKNLGVGFRIVRQIDLYLKNIPSDSILTREEAFDLQILQRVLTKIRGSQEQLQDLVGTYNKNDDNVSNSILIDKFDEYKEISDFSKSKNCIKQKAKELKIYGYTI
ncbi:McrB family protein [Candidatus Clostridium helianthi]|uniref:McrB family protein n=1 Tax=Candidatus Clostridium helianthi TaxID=3381660 RepID=A0ABW8S8U1_9CLOT